MKSSHLGVLCIAATIILLGSPSSSIAYDNYNGCNDCHGAFESGDYTSNVDGTNWNTDLMTGHRSFISGNSCDVCHSGSDFSPVNISLSDDADKPQGCVGCHGRVGDESNVCTFGNPDTDGEHCGSATGLRKFHEASPDVPQNTCYVCHTAESGATPVGEDEPPFNYGRSQIGLTSPCTGENMFGPTGLDNDGDGNVDAADSDCMATVATAGDLDFDGMADVLWRNTATGRVDYWQMNAPMITLSSIIAGVGDLNWQIIGVGDYNGDDKADILWRNVVTGRVDMWEMNGPSITLSSIVAGVSDLNWQVIGSADYTGDGKTDVLWRNMVTGRVDLWEMNGPMITLSSIVAGVADLNWQVKGSGDITGDGKADVLWRNVVTGRVDIWEMNGPMITLSSLVAGVGDPNWQIMGVGDLTGDNKDDVLWRNVVTGRVDLWEMNGPLITLSSLVAGVADLNWQIIGNYDYNGDGMHDVLWRNMVTGRVDFWEMNGPTITTPSLVAGVADLNWQAVDVD